MKLYKLTDANGRTLGQMQWGPGVTHGVAPCDNPQLCTPDVLHAYQDADLALLMNPVHGAYHEARLWEAEGEPCVTKPDKLGCFELTTVRELDVPTWFADTATRHRVQVRFAVLAARAVLDVFESARPGDDRPRKAIEAAEAYSDKKTAHAAASSASAAAFAYTAHADASAAAYAAYAAHAAASAAAYAAHAAADAAAYAAHADAADAAADAAAYAAHAAAYADAASAYTADAATADLTAFARQAVTEVAAAS